MRGAYRSLAVALMACARGPAADPVHPVHPMTGSAASGAFPALGRIAEADLRRDLFALAGDRFRGREAGTLDELRGATWIAARAGEAGLEPAGDDGTFFQWWPMRRTMVAPESRITLDGTELAIWRDAVLPAPVEARVGGPVVFVGTASERELAGRDLRGRVVAAELVPPANAPPIGRGLTPRRYAMLAVRQRAAMLTRHGATAVVLVSDAAADSEYDNIAAGWARGTYAVDTGVGDAATTRGVPVVWVRRRWLDRAQEGRQFQAMIATRSTVAPEVNVVARVRGRDPARRDEYVVFSAHHDALGVRYAWAGDSIWNGADDNASTSVALLAIGRAFAARPAARSVLFVWHAAEEAGLLGSYWFVGHPTVPKASMVAVLNGDMIGRNNADTAALLGSQPPHRNSAELVGMALAANARVGQFVIDSTWDRPSHPESFFTRSDHWPYVQVGIPAVYFSTLLHPDYHTPRDEPARINTAKLARMARWMYATGWLAASATTRPAVEHPAR